MNIYISNKYTKWYYLIITNAKNRTIECYTEKHHIIPRSLGGNNSKENLVKLLPREHYICHLLLTKMVEGPNKYKMIYAAWTMARTRSNIKVNSRLFGLLREQQAQLSKELFTGRKLSEEHKQNIGKGGKGKVPWNKGLKCENISTALKGRKNPEHSAKLKGRKLSEETKLKMSDSKKGNKNSLGHKHSEETKLRMRIAAANRKKSQ